MYSIIEKKLTIRKREIEKLATAERGRRIYLTLRRLVLLAHVAEAKNRERESACARTGIISPAGKVRRVCCGIREALSLSLKLA